MTLSFTACMDLGSSGEESNSQTDESASSQTDSSSNGFRDNVKEYKDNVNSFKEEVKKEIDGIKEEFDSSPLGKVKQGVEDIKEIVSDVNEIKDAIKGEKITVPIKSKKCKGENYQKIKEKFEDAGFTNITEKGNEKLKVGLLHDVGDVESVSINGDEKFDEGDKYYADAKIVITYYS